MSNFTNPHIAALDERIAELLEELKGWTGNSKDYTDATINLSKLMELRNQWIKTDTDAIKVENEKIKIQNDFDVNQSKIDLDEKKFAADQEKSRSWKPSPDAVVGAAASVLGIIAILNYEKLNILTSKAVSFVKKLS